MNAFISRLVIAAILLPVVLGVVHFGGWWLFALLALAAALALHEYWLLTRPMRPLAPAGYVGVALALVGAQTGGVVWMLGGVLTTFVLAFLLKGISEARQAATVAIGGTVMGAVWIGLGLAFLIAIRGIPVHAQLATYTVLLAVWAGDTFAYFGGRLLGRHRMAPSTSPKKTWEGFVFGTAATVVAACSALDNQRFPTIGELSVPGAAVAIAGSLRHIIEQ